MIMIIHVPRAMNVIECTGVLGIVNILRPRQNGRHFTDDIFKCILMNENIWISIKISLEFVSKDPNDNIPALVQIMAWHRTGDKPLSEPMVALFTDIYIYVTRPQWPFEDVAPIPNYSFSNSNQGQISWVFPVKLPWGEGYKTALMICQHCFG